MGERREVVIMVYLIHFDRPYKRARHYLGYTTNFDARMECHRKGRGSCLLRAVNNAGIGWKVVRTWPDADGNFERKLHNWKKSWQLCPVCQEERMKNIET